MVSAGKTPAPHSVHPEADSALEAECSLDQACVYISSRDITLPPTPRRRKRVRAMKGRQMIGPASALPPPHSQLKGEWSEGQRGRSSLYVGGASCLPFRLLPGNGEWDHHPKAAGAAFKGEIWLCRWVIWG